MTNIFDRCICLCIDKRLQDVTIDKELLPFGINVERFICGDGELLSQEQYDHIDIQCGGRQQAMNYGLCLKKIIQKAKDDKLTNILFLEDDAVLTPKFADIFPKSIEEIKQRGLVFDSLFIGGNHHHCAQHAGLPMPTQVTEHIIRPIYSLDLHAVCFNWTAFDIILSIEPSNQHTIDGVLAERQKKGILNVLAVHPSIITQKPNFSLNNNIFVDRSKHHCL